MSHYEIHVPCGDTIKVICKEANEEMKVVKNGKVLYGNKKVAEVAETTEVEETEEEELNSPDTSEETEMAGGKRTRRNTARKASRKSTRKNQAGGKRGPNAYMKFANKIRPQVLKEHPELKSDVVGVARKIGEKWRALSDAEKKKY